MRELASAREKAVARAGIAPSGSSSPARSDRPSIPPKFARKSVDRLPRTNGRSIPPEIASHARQPGFGRSIASSSPATTLTAWPAGICSPPIRASNAPPHHASTRASLNRMRNIPSVTSISAAASSLPASRFATRAAKQSSAPDVPTPIPRKPFRPRSCTVVSGPARKIVALILSNCRILRARSDKGAPDRPLAKGPADRAGHRTTRAACAR